MNYSDFHDFKSLATRIVANHKMNTENKSVDFLHVKCFKFERGSETVKYRCDYSGPYEEFNFLYEPTPKRKPKETPPKKLQKRKDIAPLHPERMFADLQNRVHELTPLYAGLKETSFMDILGYG